MVQLRSLSLLCTCGVLLIAVQCLNANEMHETPLQDMVNYIEKFQHNRRKLSINRLDVITPKLQNTIQKHQEQSTEQTNQEVHFTTTENITSEAPIRLPQIQPNISNAIRNNSSYVPVRSKSISNPEDSKTHSTNTKRFRLRARPKIQQQFKSTENPIVDTKSNPDDKVPTETTSNFIVTNATTQTSLRSKLFQRKPRLLISTRLLKSKSDGNVNNAKDSIIEATTFHPSMIKITVKTKIPLNISMKKVQPDEMNVNNHQTSLKDIDKVGNKTDQQPQTELDEDVSKHQAENARYEFGSEIDDGINGHLHERKEVREGLSVKGRYSYSDGSYKRTVFYEADDKGYRVVKQEVEPVQESQGNPEGHAKVSSYIAGKTVSYEITKDDIIGKNHMWLTKVDDDSNKSIL